MARTDILEKKDDILRWISENQSKAFMCRELKCKPDTLNSYLEKMGIKYLGNRPGKGIKKDSKYKTAEEYSKSICVKSHMMKLKLLRDGIKEHRCEECGLSEWKGVPIPLELHHIDENRFNNNLDNLKLICPNCHALKPNNSGKASRKNMGE